MTTISSGVSSASSWGTAPPRMDRHGGGKPSFASIDTDGSGGLSQAELQSMLDKGPGGAQGSAGTSSSAGSTSTTSGTSSTSSSLSELFSKLDTDGDGSISQSELDTGMKPPGHGAQSQNAYAGMGMDTQGFAAMMGSGMQGMGSMPPPPPPPDDAQGGINSAITSALGSLDADNNSSISLSEFGLGSTASASGSSGVASSASSNASGTDSTRQALFDMIDSDQSGDLSSTEVSAFAEQMKALFEKMQQMGAQTNAQTNAPFVAQAGDAAVSYSSLSVTA
jgi:Ca2+-binding EF-hand superfamily protein